MPRLLPLPLWLFLCLSVILPAAAAAQGNGGTTIEPPAPLPPEIFARDEEGRVTMRAVRLDRELIVDGRLDDEIYARVPPTNGFVQQEPREGEPATQPTDVWVFFDGRNVYVAARCWDTSVDKAVANELRRDHINIFNNDNFAVALDTFYDRRNGFLFQTNPIGGIGDGYMTDEREHNRDWSTVWDTRSARFDKGWTVEMVIPFKSLRYRTSGPQVWGINFRRIVRGTTNEHSFLTLIPASFAGRGIYKMSSAATLVGLEAPARSQNLELKPYAISTLTTDRTARPALRDDLGGDLGFDLKYGVTRGLVADFSYNTDFAQVEDDEQQVNLTRFSLFFPEKREFFLEGQGIFAFGGAGSRAGSSLTPSIPSETPVIFFSRRIGLDNGRTVPIVAGGRLTGKAGAFSIGALAIRTDEEEQAGAVPTTFGVVRIKRDVLRRSNLGVIVTQRTPDGDTPSNTVAGVDAAFSFFQSLNIDAYAAVSETDGMDGPSASYRGSFDYSGDKYGLQFERLVVERDFDPQVGFLRRDDFKRSFAQARISPRPLWIPGVRKTGIEATIDYITNVEGQLETRKAQSTATVEFHSGDRWSLDYERALEWIDQPFVLGGEATVGIGTYRFNTVTSTYQLGPRRRVSGSLIYATGGFYDGERTEATYRGRVELHPKFSIEPTISFNWLRMPDSDPTVRLLASRFNITLSPRMLVGALLQYNSSTHALGTNVRFRWEYVPGSDLFVVYTEGRDTLLGDRLGFLQNRTLALKITRLVRF